MASWNSMWTQVIDRGRWTNNTEELTDPETVVELQYLNDDGKWVRLAGFLTYGRFDDFVEKTNIFRDMIQPGDTDYWENTYGKEVDGEGPIWPA